MKFLSTPQKIESTLKVLLRNCDRLRWAVAWALHRTSLFTLLKQNEDKIQQLTVGIHFYQTHPDFIAAFLDNDAAHFVMHPKGVFHPKLYFFEFDDGKWECVTGSANFTHGAFTNNAEVAVHFSKNDEDSTANSEKLVSTLDSYSSKGKRLTSAELEQYRSVWNQCLCCGETRRLTIDHIQASYYARRNDEDNLQTLCYQCNSIKGTHHIDFRNHGTSLNQPLATLDMLDGWMPSGNEANSPASWERYLRRCINFFYQCAAVESIDFDESHASQKAHRISLFPGNPYSWIEPHLDKLRERIPGLIFDTERRAVPQIRYRKRDKGNVNPLENSSFVAEMSGNAFSMSTTDSTGISLRQEMFQLLASKACTGREVSLELTGKPDRIPAYLKDEQYPTASGQDPTIVGEKQPGSRAVIYRLIQGNIKEVRSLTEPLQLATDNGVKRALVPIQNKHQFLEVSGDIMEHVDPVFYGDPKAAAFKALGMN